VKDKFAIFVALSIAFHLLVGGGTFYVLPLLHYSPTRMSLQVPVKIVKGSGTARPAQAKPGQTQAAAPKKTVGASKPVVPKPAEAKPVPAKPSPKPPVAKPEKPQPPKPPKPNKKTIVVNDKNAKKPEEKKPEAEQPEADFTSLLKNIAPPSKKKPQEPQPETPADAAAGFSQLLAGFSDSGDATGSSVGSPGGDAAGSAFGSPDGNVVDADEITVWSSAVNAQFAACWNIEPGAAGMRDIAVEIEVKVGPDLAIRQAEIVDKGRMARDGVFRAAAERARRALLDPDCNPLPQPPLGLDITNEKVIFNFDPGAMF